MTLGTSPEVDLIPARVYEVFLPISAGAGINPEAGPPKRPSLEMLNILISQGMQQKLRGRRIWQIQEHRM